MEIIKCSFDSQSFQSKPNATERSAISTRIGGNQKELNTPNDIENFTAEVSSNGCTFCPATFRNGCRRKENFEQQQMFALDFDNKEQEHFTSFLEIKNRADIYELPVLFAYETLSSIDNNKFRIVFLNDIPVPDRMVAEAVLQALGIIFPEADASCYKDVSKMYFGGKQRIYYDNEIPVINIELVFRSLTYYLKDRYGENHYKEKLLKFSNETGIALNRNGLLDVTVKDNPTEYSGATNINGKNSPRPIIYSKNIITDGEIFRMKYYYIFLNEKNNVCTSNISVTSKKDKKQLKNHKPYRSSVIKAMNQGCKLYREFEEGTRKLEHDEVFALLTNMINAETGTSKFKSIMSANPNFGDDRVRKWERHIPYVTVIQEEYNPESCSKFCRYSEECSHSANILSTVCPKRGIMEKISGYCEELYPLEEVQDDTYRAIKKAVHADGKRFRVIKSMTAAGKTTSYLRLMQENPGKRFLIAVPLNRLKDELYEKAGEMGIEIRKTPSLEEISCRIPYEIWTRIQRLYRDGKYKSVHPYIESVLQKRYIPCLEEYMEEREEMKHYKGNVITTHRYLLNMEGKQLGEYYAVIIDEDIFFKSIISNQCAVTVSDFRKELNAHLRHEPQTCRPANAVTRKMQLLLELAETRSCIELGGFEWKYKTVDEKRELFDIPAFCMAEKFYLRRASEEVGLEEDTIVFLKPAKFNGEKYIMVSATADEAICRKFFGEGEVEFYECRKAGYRGTLYQYPGKSMSRTSVANSPGIIGHLIEKFDIKKKNVITFKKENTGTLYFGNADGSNMLEGENVLIAGTPYHVDFLYKLIAFTLDTDFDMNEKMAPQFVAHNGYRFYFTTYENDSLRKVHFWMIESELEQAVGRARLLRNKCVVRLFSNFPLSQAKMVNDFDYGKSETFN